jgi:formylglycine-generating enzyme required for sulfatase activity
MEQLLPEERDAVEGAVQLYVGLPNWADPACLPTFVATVDESIRHRVHWRCREEVAIHRFFRRSRSVPVAPLGCGTRLGSCELLEVLGSGGMGTVYRARQLGLDRDVAVKVVRADLAIRLDIVSRFRREGAHAAQLDHPCIVDVHAFEEHDGNPYFVMDLVSGPSLQDVLDAAQSSRPLPGNSAALFGQPLTPHWCTKVLGVVADIASALAHAHRRGVVHRDVKPSNVLLDAAGRPRIVDFGLARHVDAQRLTLDQHVIGTLAYLSPERMRGDEHDTRQGDTWALAVILHELLTLEHPFDHAGALRPRAMLVGGAGPRVARLPVDLRRILETALAADPADRYPSAEEFERDLLRVLAGEPARTVRPPAWQRWRRHAFRNRRRYELALGLCAAFALGALALQTWMHRDDPRLSIAMPAGSTSATATLARMDAIADCPVSLVAGLTLPVDRQRLEPGTYRITVVDAGQRVAEIVRELNAGDDENLIPTLRTTAVLTDGMVRIPTGERMVGIKGADGYRAMHTVLVPEFFIDRTEVTCGQYHRFLVRHPDVEPPRSWRRHGGVYDPAWEDLPVAGVSWIEAERYAEWLGKRLPTALEWEVAARGSDGREYPWGDQPPQDDSQSIVNRGGEWSAGVAAVGTKTDDQSPWGVSDMFGNVSEWTATPRIDDVDGVPHPVSSQRTVLGFSWRTKIVNDGYVIRYGMIFAAPSGWEHSGFRCATSATTGAH